MLNYLSFDFATNNYPKSSWITEGAAVVHKNSITLVPPVVGRAGEIKVKRKIRSQSIQVDLTFIITSAMNNNYGFAIWYINSNKPISDSKGSLFGFKGDYSGLGIFVMKDSQDNWVVHGNTNRGMQEYKISQDKLNAQNTCAIYGAVENVPRTIK